MKNVNVTLVFYSVEEAGEFLAGWSGKKRGATLAEPVVQEGNAPTAMASVMDMIPPTVEVKDSVPQTTTVETKSVSAPDPGGKITGTAIKAALADFKKVHGHPKYKALLGYFGVSAVRDIPKSEYTTVMGLIAQGGVGSATQTVPMANTAPEVQSTQPEYPEATAGDLMQALGTHKAMWGIEATKAFLVRAGYPDPNGIPHDEYGKIIHELEHDNPTASDEPALPDLSNF